MEYRLGSRDGGHYLYRVEELGPAVVVPAPAMSWCRTNRAASKKWENSISKGFADTPVLGILIVTIITLTFTVLVAYFLGVMIPWEISIVGGGLLGGGCSVWAYRQAILKEHSLNEPFFHILKHDMGLDRSQFVKYVEGGDQDYVIVRNIPTCLSAI